LGWIPETANVFIAIWSTIDPPVNEFSEHAGNTDLEQEGMLQGG